MLVAMKTTAKKEQPATQPKPGARVFTMPFGQYGTFDGYDRHGRALVIIDGRGSVPDAFHPGNVRVL